MRRTLLAARSVWTDPIGATSPSAKLRSGISRLPQLQDCAAGDDAETLLMPE